MTQRLTIALAEMKAGNISGKLLNETREIINSVYRGKGITKKVFKVKKQNGHYIYEFKKQWNISSSKITTESYE